MSEANTIIKHNKGRTSLQWANTPFSLNLKKKKKKET